MCFFRKRKKAKLEAERKAREEAERKATEEKAAAQAAEEEAARKANLERLQALQDQQKEVTVEKPKITKKPAAKKAAPAKKAASAKKEAPAKKEEAPVVEEKVEKEPAKKTAKDSKSVYHVSKREEDGMWQIKYTGGRVIKLCKTKAEAMDYAKEMANNQEGTVIFHPSKGKSKGKFQKA